MDPQLALIAYVLLGIVVFSVTLIFVYLVLRFAIRDGVRAALEQADRRG